MASSGGRFSIATGGGWNRRGPANETGDTRSPQTGSVRTRRPSISSSVVEWPSHVTRSPDETGRAQPGRGSSTFSACAGRRSTPRPPKKYSPVVDHICPGFIGEATGSVFWKRPSTKRGDETMRSRRSPLGMAPKPEGRGQRPDMLHSMPDGAPGSLRLVAGDIEGPPAYIRGHGAADPRGRQAMETTAKGWNVLERDGAILWRQYSFGSAGVATTMVFRGAGDGLIVVSPGSRVEESALDELADFGKVVALVASNSFHWLGQPMWRKRFPEARSFAPAQGLKRLAKKMPDARFEPLEALAPLLGDRATVVDPPGFKVGNAFATVRGKSGTYWYPSDLL